MISFNFQVKDERSDKREKYKDDDGDDDGGCVLTPRFLPSFLFCLTTGGPGTLYMDSMSTDDEILKAAKNVLSTHWHVSQTCAMGLETGEVEVVVAGTILVCLFGVRPLVLFLHQLI